MPNTMHLLRNTAEPDIQVFACPVDNCWEDPANHPGTKPAGMLYRGRARASVINGRDKLWDEWQFVPHLITDDAAPIRDDPRAAIDARTDARIYVQSLAL